MILHIIPASCPDVSKQKARWPEKSKEDLRRKINRKTETRFVDCLLGLGNNLRNYLMDGLLSIRENMAAQIVYESLKRHVKPSNQRTK